MIVQVAVISVIRFCRYSAGAPPEKLTSDPVIYSWRNLLDSRSSHYAFVKDRSCDFVSHHECVVRLDLIGIVWSCELCCNGSGSSGSNSNFVWFPWVAHHVRQSFAPAQRLERLRYGLGGRAIFYQSVPQLQQLWIRQLLLGFIRRFDGVWVNAFQQLSESVDAAIRHDGRLGFLIPLRRCSGPSLSSRKRLGLSATDLCRFDDEQQHQHDQ